MDRRDFIRTTGLGALALGLGCGGDEGTEASDGGGHDGGAHDGGAPARKPFSIVALPDTQYYSRSYPSIYLAQTQWIADKAAAERIQFVTHLGDIVDNGPDLGQWKTARQCMSVLDKAKIPYGVCLGNHDLQFSNASYQYPTTVDGSCTGFADFDCTAKDYLESFGPKVFAGRPWFGGGSPSGLSTYQLITVEGLKLLFLHLALDQRKSELSWAQQALDKHPDALVHVTTHRYMYDLRLVKGVPYPLSTLLGGRYPDAFYGIDDKLHFKDGTMADAFFSTFVAKNTNIFMVQCGHFDGEYRQEDDNAAGLPVHQLLVDFQTYSPKGGDGWLRLLTFDLDRKQLRVRTYSPSLKRYRKNGDGFDAATKALLAGLNAYKDLFKLILDINALQKQANYWCTDPKGRQEYHKLLYDGGQRDSDFTLDVDFDAYLASKKKKK